MSLEFTVGLKAGIGTSFEKAEAALKRASELKEQISEDDVFEVARDKVLRNINDNKYAIVLYEGEEILNEENVNPEEEEELETRVRRSIDDLGAVKNEYGEHSLAYEALENQINERSSDPTTGALTPFGYLLKQQTQVIKPKELPEGIEHFYILIDANDMHYWNDKKTYGEVTRHLKAIGQALVEAARTKEKPTPEVEERRSFQSRTIDLVSMSPRLVTRTHGSAGDEFLIDLYCKKEDVKNIVTRFIDCAYAKQEELYTT